MKEIINNIRKNSIVDFLKVFILAILFCGMSIGFFYATFANGFSGESLFLAIVSLPFGILALIQTINSVKLIINPFNSNVFKKYGSAEKIAQIYDEIEKTTEFENYSIVISKNYLCDKKRVENLVAFNDVLAVHKLVHKVNFQIDYYQIVVTDKYGEEIRFQFGKEEENLVNTLMQTIAKRTPNAELGYTQDEFDHIKRNKIPLNNNATSDKLRSEPFTATFKSDEQKRVERIKAAKRKKAFKNFWKCIVCILLSIILSEMLLMIILGDSVEDVAALVLVFFVAIPFFAIFYYLFIGRKNKSPNYVENSIGVSTEKCIETESSTTKEAKYVSKIETDKSSLDDKMNDYNIKEELKNQIVSTVNKYNIIYKTDLLKIVFGDISQQFEDNENADMLICLYYQTAFDIVLSENNDTNDFKFAYATLKNNVDTKIEIHKYLKLLAKIQSIIDEVKKYIDSGKNGKGMYAKVLKKHIFKELNAYVDDSSDWNKIKK